MKYAIIFSGKLLPGYDLKKVVSLLFAQGMKKEDIKRILESKNKIINTSDNLDQIESISVKLIKCGLDCRVLKEDQPIVIEIPPDESELPAKPSVEVYRNFYARQSEQLITYLFSKKWINRIICCLVVFFTFVFAGIIADIPTMIMFINDEESLNKMNKWMLLLVLPHVVIIPFFAKYIHIMLIKLKKENIEFYCVIPCLVTVCDLLAVYALNQPFDFDREMVLTFLQRCFGCYYYCKMIIVGPERFTIKFCGYCPKSAMRAYSPFTK
jgi:hypothetical protein